MAEAGFFCDVSSNDSKDGVTCFLCSSHLPLTAFSTGRNSDPLTVHWAANPSCPWALILSSGKAKKWEDSVNWLDLRLSTFTTWPDSHPLSSRQVICVSQTLNYETHAMAKMALAGFHYDPLPEDIDNVSCSACQVSLQGWEVGDDPLKEHAARRPRCALLKKVRDAYEREAAIIQEAVETTSSTMEVDTTEDKENDIVLPSTQEQSAPKSPLDVPRLPSHPLLSKLDWSQIQDSEKDLTVSEFIKQRQVTAKSRLEDECRRMLSLFQLAGNRTLKE